MGSELKDLLDRAAAIDEVGLPDLDLVERRVHRRHTIRAGGWVMLALALVVAVAASVQRLAVSGLTPEIVGQPDGSWAEWSLLPQSPLDGRSGHVVVWADGGTLVWGGWLLGPMGMHPDQEPAGYAEPDQRTELGEVAFADGAAFDPESGRWQPIADAPIASGYGTQAVWTGREMIVVTNGDIQTAEAHVVAYAPGSDRWRVIEHPIGAGAALTSVWTGREMLVWGAFDHRAGRGDIGYAYNPDTDRWRELPDAPVPARQWHTAVWTGSEMIVWGGSDLTGRADKDLGGAAYSPAANRWRTIADAPIPYRYNHTVVWTGSEMIVWGGQTVHVMGDGAAYDPANDSWRVLPRAPIDGRISHVTVWDGDAMIIWGGTPMRDGPAFDDGAAYLPESNRWTRLPSSPLEGRCHAGAAATPSGIAIWGGAIGCDEGHAGGHPAADGALLHAQPSE